MAIVAAYLAAMLGVGYLLTGRVRAFSDFFVAHRGLTTPMLICGLVSSYYGLDALFGDSGDASREGVVVWFTYGRPYTLALLLTGVLISRRLGQLNFLSLADVLAYHYGKPAQVAGAIASFFYALPILSIMGLAAAGEVILGLPMWLGAVVGSAIAVAYTAMGGFWADAVTDVAQFLIMTISLAVAVPFALAAVGGFGGLQDRLGASFFDPLGSAPPLYTLAYALTALSVLVEPLFYQRVFAARTVAAVRNAFLWGLLIWGAYDWLVTAAGMAGGGLMAAGVLPADTPRDHVLLRVAALYLPVGLAGLFLGGCLATAMSTIDSYLLIAAGNLVYDIYRPLVKPDLPDRALIRYTRICMVVSAAMSVLIGLYFQRIKEAWNFMATILTATLLIPLLAALFLPGRRTPLAGTLASWGGLAAVVAFFAVLEVYGAPLADLDTRMMPFRGLQILREYALFVALPISALGYVVGSVVGRRG